jgi:hypothetical protein
MPGIVSARTLVISAQAALARRKPRRNRVLTRWTSQTIGGSGNRVTIASQGSMLTRTTAVSVIVRASLRKSERLTERI